ncbi:DUF5805 domain-containing protein [Halobacterium yunchengense]|uniref:DUF5805 domain-containing protein n=1 Tax=Halobacterium yunchengense TaxID=3108497 RepID=UPI003008C46E
MADDDRVVVKTYVPPEQKAEWREAAADLEMSQSEFLRTMVQAGRRGFLDDPEEGGSADATPGGEGLEDRVLDALSGDEFVSWDELVAELSGDFEDRLYETVQSLHAEGRIDHDPREGGYALPGER